MNGYFCVLTTIDFFVLCFMCILTYLSETLSKKQKRGFFLAFVLIAGISVLEVITLVVDGLPPGYRWLNITANYLGFGLSPAVCICLVYVLDRKTALRREIRTAVRIEIGYLIFLFVTIPCGIVFSVSADNIYSRGPHFYIYVIMYFGAILYLSISTIIKAREFQNRSRKLIYPLIVFLTAETIIQVMSPELRVTWLCVTLLSVLYFIYCNEMWNQLDALTGLLNQNSYLNQTQKIKYNSGVLVVFDVDDFKKINDQFGHQYGDQCLSTIAGLILKSFSGIGFCYRIGGDEFGVLSDKADEIDILNAISLFINNLNSSQEQDCNLPLVSMGYSIYHKSEGSIEQAISKADAQLYRYKKLHKQETKEPGKTNCNFSCSLTERTPH